jgi:hypothetical protein
MKAKKRPARKAGKRKTGRPKGGPARSKTFVPQHGARHVAEELPVPAAAPAPPPSDQVAEAATLEGFTPVHYLSAYYMAHGIPGRIATQLAGDHSARSKQGVTAAEFNQREDFQALKKRFVLEQIKEAELDGRLGAMCRGEHPTKVTVEPDGRPRAEYDLIEAQKLANKLLGRLKERHEHSGPDGKPIAFSDVTDEDLAALGRRAVGVLERAGETGP